MPNIRVYRYPCVLSGSEDDITYGTYCKLGPDIIDSLLTSELALRLRGKNEIDFNISNRVIVSGTCKIHNWVNPGALVDIDDNQLGRMKGLLRSFSLSISRDGDRANAVTNVRIEREADE